MEPKFTEFKKGTLKFKQNLYYAINNKCTNNCEFCFNKGINVKQNITAAREKLKKIIPFIHTVTIGGGEPLMARKNIKLYDDKQYTGNIFDAVMLDCMKYNNSLNIDVVTSAPRKYFFDEYYRGIIYHSHSIIISRHAISDEENSRIFNAEKKMPLLTVKDIQNLVTHPQYYDNNIRLSCTLGEHGVNSVQDMRDYIKEAKKQFGEIDIIFNDLRPNTGNAANNLIKDFWNEPAFAKHYVSNAGYKTSVLPQGEGSQKIILKHYFQNQKEFELEYQKANYRTHDLSLMPDGRLYQTWHNKPDEEIDFTK
ncbi:MAG: radical SAM protein [Christensenellaceae bacterium]|jgi:hypothetical protein|nr:radical SAM protein [Christensenellaceae bacterium]